MSTLSNAFLDSLLSNAASVAVEDFANRDEMSLPVQDDEEQIIACAIWLEEKGLNPGVMGYELLDDQNNLLATVDLAWPDGFQTGLGRPAALLIQEPEQVHHLMSKQGFQIFTCTDSLKRFVEDNYQASAT